MIEIDIDPDYQDLISVDRLQVAAKEVLALTETNTKSEFGLKITGDTSLQQLNLEYMGIDSPTDVLSFPVPFENPDTGYPYLGDILISYPTAARQAEKAGHPPQEEITLLLVHGILHLLGYDHSNQEDKAEMWTLQEKILTHLKIDARPTE